VEILPAHGVEPREWTAMERARLNFFPHAPPGNNRLRLACQVRLSGSGGGGDQVEVIKRSMFWGQGEEVVQVDSAPSEGSLEGSLQSQVLDDSFADGGEGRGELQRQQRRQQGQGVTPLGALEFVLDREEWKKGGALNNRGGGDKEAGT
jgi:hypothetical protein